MTWTALCPFCHSQEFLLTHGSSEGTIHVNCARPECAAYIGRLIPDTILHMPAMESH